ncbi:hypothetical protein JKP88DRAFT_351482 [Tribonema minus]|uniref:Uncharacterized protein n=1 Tax=Tribonema minus TaxID=303371 RepID=A0A835YHH0_9STRA|nr:hypothetical protein JKP88DRAFT_351482 [Tribonema minus]
MGGAPEMSDFQAHVLVGMSVVGAGIVLAGMCKVWGVQQVLLGALPLIVTIGAAYWLASCLDDRNDAEDKANEEQLQQAARPGAPSANYATVTYQTLSVRVRHHCSYTRRIRIVRRVVFFGKAEFGSGSCGPVPRKWLIRHLACLVPPGYGHAGAAAELRLGPEDNAVHTGVREVVRVNRNSATLKSGLTSGPEDIAAASGLDQDWQHVEVPTGLMKVPQPQGHVVATAKAVYATVAHGLFSHGKQFEHQQQLERETAAAVERALAWERRQLQKAAAIMAMLEGALLQHQLHQITTVNKGLAEMWRRQQQQQQLQCERDRAEGLAAELVQERERHQEEVRELQAQHDLAQTAAVAAALADERQRHQLLLRDAAMAGLSPMAAQLQVALQQAQQQQQQELTAVAAAVEAQHLTITQELDDLRQQHQSLHGEYTWYRVRRQMMDMSLNKQSTPAASAPPEAKPRSVLVTVPSFAD